MGYMGRSVHGADTGFFLEAEPRAQNHRGYSESMIMGMVGSVICFLRSNPIDPIGTWESWDEDPA